MENRIVFMGTPAIAADVLQALLDARANIVLAVTQPDRPSGRKNQLHACEVKQLAIENDIPVFQPERIRKDYQALVDAQPDLIITCAYGQIVPKEVLDLPKRSAVNLHGSILPEYRGAAPIQRAIMDGKKQSGMSLMKMEVGMDTGGVADVEFIDLSPDETTTSLFEKMGQAAGRLVVKNLDALLEGTLEFVPQEESKATYAAKISREEEEIDLSGSDQQIYNQIRGLSRTPGGFVNTKAGKLKILSARYEKGNTPGLGVFDKQGKKQMIMGLHDGVLLLDEVQLPGKPAMKSVDFVNGKGRSLLNTKAGE